MVFQSHISTLIKQHSFKSLVAASLCLIVFGCSRNESLSAEYQEACHGEPLTTVAQRNQALEDGFVINQQFKCIDKASYLAMQEAEAQGIAARSPEALARKKQKLKHVMLRLQDKESRKVMNQKPILLRSMSCVMSKLTRRPLGS